jgi:polyphenol oxidase
LSPAGFGAVPSATPALPTGVRSVREEPSDGPVPLHVHPEWQQALGWLVQGTTGRGDDGGDDGAFDLGLFGATPVAEALARWRSLQRATGAPRIVHSRQHHGATLLDHADGPPGLAISDGFDGHLTDRPGVILTVSVADCVPISLVDTVRGRIALLHGGWRGTARGILRHGLDRLGADRAEVRMHLGPAICGPCYEVGPEVHEALGLPVPVRPAPVDVRAVQARQAIEAGVRAEHITVSEHCTRCGDRFFSHRAGSPGRQLGLLGIRP